MDAITLSARTKDLSGSRFARLLAVKPVEKRANGHIVYLCNCDCGENVLATNSNLKSGHTQSCGCLCRERTSQANTSHGKARTRIYGVWRQMIERCHKPYAPNYHWYGGRGVRVVNSWHVFDNFYKDMGDPPPGYTLDRIDVDGDYGPHNCRWASRKEQARNTRRNVWLTCNGKTQILTDWERQAGSKDKIGKRLRKGMPFEQAMAEFFKGKEP